MKTCSVQSKRRDQYQSDNHETNYKNQSLYHNIVYNFLARSQPKMLVVACAKSILLQNRYYQKISKKHREKKRKNMCNKVKSKKDKSV